MPRQSFSRVAAAVVLASFMAVGHASAQAEGKADILGLHMVQQLNRQGELKGEDSRNSYVTSLASLFR